MKRLVIGLGTGRCGTKSLAYLLNLQSNVKVSHEMAPVFRFNKSEHWLPICYSKIDEILSREEQIVGDVAFCNLWRSEEIADYHKNTVFVCLKRNKEEVVRSFTEKCLRNNHGVGCRNFWDDMWFVRVNGKKVRRRGSNWDQVFPNFSGRTLDDVISRYYDWYYEEVDKLEIDVKIFDIDDLNTVGGIIRILDFVGVQSEDRIIKTNIKISHHMKEVLQNEN